MRTRTRDLARSPEISTLLWAWVYSARMARRAITVRPERPSRPLPRYAIRRLDRSSTLDRPTGAVSGDVRQQYEHIFVFIEQGTRAAARTSLRGDCVGGVRADAAPQRSTEQRRRTKTYGANPKRFPRQSVSAGAITHLLQTYVREKSSQFAKFFLPGRRNISRGVHFSIEGLCI